MMIRVDFYLLKDNYPQARDNYICRLIEKAYQHRHKVYSYFDSPESAQRIDELLWTFKDSSFIPHTIYDHLVERPAPIQLGHIAPAAKHSDILINLTATLPAFYSQFQRIIEVVLNLPEERNLARASYRCYRQAACELTLHDLAKKN